MALHTMEESKATAKLNELALKHAHPLANELKRRHEPLSRPRQASGGIDRDQTDSSHLRAGEETVAT